MSLVCCVLISCNKCNALFLWKIFIFSGTWTGLWSYPYLDRPVILPIIPVAQFAKVRNPILLQGRGRPMGASNNSACRDPSRFELVENADIGLHCGHCGVRGMGHNSKTCPERARIMVIKRPVLEEPAMEWTSNADPVSLNNSTGRNWRTVICVNCGWNHYRKTPCWNRNLWLPFKKNVRVFSNVHHVFSKPIFVF